MTVNSKSAVWTTPIISAALVGDVEATAGLIQAGADLSSTDHLGTTALFYAASHGYADIVKMLVDAKAPINDGSLHAAAASCSLGIIKLLLEAGHDPSLPSRFHNQQPPLEVALRQGRGNYLKETLQLLHQYGADPTYRKNGKSLLFMALDMENAGPVVPLLRAFMGKMVNKDFNLYEDNSLVYSPLSYVIHDKANVTPARKEDLIRILRLGGCKEAYYHKTGPQPAGFKNPPGALAWQEESRDKILRVDPIISWMMEPEELQLQIRGYEAWKRANDTDRFLGFRRGRGM